MRKLRLKLENLQVESFAVAESRAERGTVAGREQGMGWSPGVDSCSGGRLCACATYEYTYCGMCVTDEISYCQVC